MTEADWLASTDPAAMLKSLELPRELPQGRSRMPSERKLRLFACAFARLLEPHPEREPVLLASEQVADGLAHPAELERARKSIDAVWGWTWAATQLNIGRALGETLIQMRGNAGSFYRQDEAAALLREVVGNPFQPVVPEYRCAACVRERHDQCVAQIPASKSICACRVCWNTNYPWLTPLIKSLAQAAYDERERDCDECVDGDVGCPDCDGAGYYYDPPYSLRRFKCEKCDEGLLAEKCLACHGTGKTDDGTLDPHRLAVLSDALEDAGCTDEGILRHLRGKERCPGYWKEPVESGRDCPICGAERRINHSWIDLRGPHVRGCHVLDLLLGLS